MTSVPKPLKFLRPHYGTLKAYYETMANSDLKVGFLVMAPHCYPSLILFNSTRFSIAEILSRHTISIGTDNVCRGRTGLFAFFNIYHNMFLLFLCFNITCKGEFFVFGFPVSCFIVMCLRLIIALLCLLMKLHLRINDCLSNILRKA